MRAAIVTILLMAIWQDGLQAQTVIGGSVLNAQGKPIEAYVSVTDKKTGSILAYSDVDSKGNYKLSFETDADSVVVTASGLTIGILRLFLIVPSRFPSAPRKKSSSFKR